MFRKPNIHFLCFWIHVRKKDGIAGNWFDVDRGIAKVGGTALGGQAAVHEHGGHASTCLVRKAGAVAVTML